MSICLRQRYIIDLLVYYSREEDLAAAGRDVMTVDLAGLIGYTSPNRNNIEGVINVVKNIRLSDPSGRPLWPCQYWFIQLASLFEAELVRLPLRRDLLTIPQPKNINT